MFDTGAGPAYIWPKVAPRAEFENEEHCAAQ